MRILAFDTSSRVSAVAVLDAERVLAEEHAPSDALHGETLVPRIRDAMQTAGLAFDALDLIAVGTGPGSFTGLRVGLATAKGLALATGTPLRGVRSLDALSRAALRGAPATVGAVAVCMTDAYRGEVFVAAHVLAADGTLRAVLPPACAKPEAAIAVVRAALDEHAPTATVLFCGDGIAAHRDALVLALERGGRVLGGAAAPAAPDARFVAEEAQLAFTREGASDLATLDPYYLRDAEITLPARV